MLARKGSLVIVNHKLITYLFVLISCLTTKSFAQVVDQKQKLSPLLEKKLASIDPSKKSSYLITTNDRISFLNFILEKKKNFSLIKEYESSGIFLLEATWNDVSKYVIPSRLVTFIDEKRRPKEELILNGFDLSTNKINLLHDEFPQWNGDSVVVSVKEDKVDSADIDFKGKFLSTSLSSKTISSHASIMATMIAGAGNTYYEGEGVAPAATISSSDFTTLLPDDNASYQQYKISVQNHSYGTGIENFYGADAAAYDASTLSNPSLLHIFSIGNSGNNTDTIGNYAGVQNYANITGSFKMAKNIITVGAIDSFGTVVPLSSKGPAYDGRVKPDLVAFGIDGTSGSAAIVSGISLVLQQAYKETHAGALPSSAFIKSILINSADDVESKNLDYKSGYGSVNAYKAIQTLLSNKIFSGNIATGDSKIYNLNIPAGIRQLKLTLVWNDTASSPNAPEALINDLDVELQLPSASFSWKPWVLNSFPDADSLKLLPVRKRDSLNNVEQITLDNPDPGDYVIRVTGYSIATSAQDFFIAYQLDTANVFKWCYPTKGDNIFSGAINTLRWQSNYSTQAGKIEYSTDGTTWFVIDPSADLSKGFYQWTAPDTFSTCQLRMTINSGNIFSDTFTISNRINTSVAFNCKDSFSFYWNKAAAINNYQVYRLGDKYLEPLFTTPDTFAIINKIVSSSLYYSVAPIIANKAGVKSYTFNYETQGVGCYIKSFLVSLADSSSIKLDLELGTIYQVKEVVWEKLTLSGYTTLQTVSIIPATQLSYTDATLTNGANIYRVKIILNSGQIIYSEPEIVYYLNKKNYTIFPDPASQNESINILSKVITDDILMQVFNSSGMLVYKKPLDDIIVTIPSGRLSKGFYYILISNKGIREALLKLVVH
jgi:hypothetical protein